MQASDVPANNTFVAFSDGSCLGNPGKGGWAYIIQRSNPAPGWDGKLSGYGSARSATNNQMELLAAIECLQHLGPAELGTVFCDSQYVVKGVNEWRKGWEKRGWKNSNNKPVANVDLWKALYAEVDRRSGVTLAWVKGHADSEMNNAVDVLANTAARNQSPTTYSDRGTPPEAMDSPTAREMAQVLLVRAETLCDLPASVEPVMARILDAYGSHERAVAFLYGSIPSLSATPMQLIVDGNQDVVLDHLDRIAHGVYA